MLRWLAVVLLAFVGCATYRQELNRGQRLYEENKWEQALAIWRGLEHDSDALSKNDQARYAYLRGMTDFRLNFRADSRHWLAIAKATEQKHPGGLSDQWKQNLERTLDELNQEVYGGAEALDASAGEGAGAEPAPGSDSNMPPQQPVVCQSSGECPVGYVCQDGACIQL